MAIQLRRGAYENYDASKLKPAEVGVVQSGDPNTTDGKAVYIAINTNDVKRIPTADEMVDHNVEAEGIYENIVAQNQTASQLFQNTSIKAAEAEQSANSASSASASANSSMQRAETAADLLTNVTATAQTLEAGQQATASYSNGVFSFGLPKGDTHKVQSMIAGVESSAVATKNYAIGDLVIVGSILYEVTMTIASGETISASNTVATTVDNVIRNKIADSIDDTLTVSGKAADAKKTGDKIGAIGVTVNGITSKNYTEGKNISANSIGYSIVDDPNACVSEVIPLTWTWDANTYCKFYYTDDTSDSASYAILFFDADMNWITHYGKQPSQIQRAVKGNDNAAYVQFSFKKGVVGKLTDSANPPTVTYWEATETVTTAGLVQNVGDMMELETTEKSSLVGAVNEVKGSVPDFPIDPTDTTFFHFSKNMIDPSTCVEGQFVNQANGAFQDNPGYVRTGYIEVEPETTYVVRKQDGAVLSGFRYAFYNDSKRYITGAVGTISDMLLTSPANAKYIAMSDTALNTSMFALYENEDKSYEPYDNVYVLNEYIKQNMDDVLLTIPSKIYALVGYELNIYFENITEEWEKYKWDVTCSKGIQLERGYRITPVTGDVGTYTLTIKASLSDTINKEVTTTLVVTFASAGASITKSMIVLGDSTTNNGIAITKLNENFSTDVMSISTLGTRGTAPNNHEGRSGWKLSDYFTVEYIDYTDGRGHVENPFYNPTTQTFDADYYFTNSGITKPDWFIINMGINDVFGYEVGTALESAINTCIGYVDSMVASVKSASPSSKIGICLTIPPNHSQDAFGKAYKNGQTRYRYKKNNTIWVNRLIAEYDNRESEGIYLIPIHTNLDTVYNMGMETLPVNARNTTVTYQSPISNGGVHPVESGYWQIADVYTAFLKAHI